MGFTLDGFEFLIPNCHASLKSWLKPSNELINTLKGETEILATKNTFKLPQETLVKPAIKNYIRRLTVNVINESYFLFDKSNLRKETFIEINKIVLIYGFLSYFVGKKQEN